MQFACFRDYRLVHAAFHLLKRRSYRQIDRHAEPIEHILRSIGPKRDRYPCLGLLGLYIFFTLLLQAKEGQLMCEIIPTHAWFTICRLQVQALSCRTRDWRRQKLITLLKDIYNMTTGEKYIMQV